MHGHHELVAFGVATCVALVTFGASGVSAQPALQLSFDRVYTCATTTCTAAGDPCDYGVSGVDFFCEEEYPGWPVCADHAVEVYCCRPGVTGDCPPGTDCAAFSDLDFGICLGGRVSVCDSTPEMEDLEECRGDFVGGIYDWGHGDCDADGIQNQDDDDVCRRADSPPSDASGSTSGTSFRGGGGCVCRAAGAPPIDWGLWPLVALLLVLRRRR